MTEFEVAGQTYRSGKMNARTQFHVLRRMAPIVEPLQALASGGVGAEAFPSLVTAIGLLSDEASDYILDQCLSVVERKQASGWAKIRPSHAGGLSSGQLMFQDINMLAMLQIAAHVLRDNYTELFREGLAAFSGEAKPFL